jgi:hypothetical protein
VTERDDGSAAIAAEVYRDAALVIDSALRGDRAGVVGAFDAAVNGGGVRGAFEGACCLAATLVGDGPGGGPGGPGGQRRLGGRGAPGGRSAAAPGFAVLDFPGIDQARYDARWVARFVSAYANSDTPTGEALFGAAMVDGQLSECLLTLAGSTVATLKRRESGA